MVQIDIPAGFVVSLFAIDLGRNALKKIEGKNFFSHSFKPPLAPDRVV